MSLLATASSTLQISGKLNCPATAVAKHTSTVRLCDSRKRLASCWLKGNLLWMCLPTATAMPQAFPENSNSE
jgi:hypothetical protein